MKDSFDNRLEVGDRILCIEPREFNTHRRNQVGTIVKIKDYNKIVINYDLPNEQGWSCSELNIQPNHGNYLVKNQDKFIKIETHTEVEYRVGDKVFYYFHSFINKACSGTIIEKHSDSIYTIQNEFGYIHLAVNSEILFLLERDNCEIENEVIKIIKNNGGIK